MEDLNRKGEILIFAEQDNGVLSEVPLELLSKGRELADTLKVPLACVLVGDKVGGLARKLIQHGADTVYVADDPRLKDYQTASYARVVGDLITERRPQICIFGATPMGRDLAPTVASAQRCGLTADCTDLQIGNYTDPATKQEQTSLLLQIRPAFGGNIIATIVNPYNWPQMATVREGVMRMSSADTGGRPGRRGRRQSRRNGTAGQGALRGPARARSTSRRRASSWPAARASGAARTSA